MATSPSTICAHPGCQSKTDPGKRVCAKHAELEPKHRWGDDRYRGSRQQRGYGRKWERTRIRVLIRDYYLCQNCKRNGIASVATEVDHKTPKSQGGTDDDENLEGICTRCHRDKTARE